MPLILSILIVTMIVLAIQIAFVRTAKNLIVVSALHLCVLIAMLWIAINSDPNAAFVGFVIMQIMAIQFSMNIVTGLVVLAMRNRKRD